MNRFALLLGALVAFGTVFAGSNTASAQCYCYSRVYVPTRPGMPFYSYYTGRYGYYARGYYPYYRYRYVYPYRYYYRYRYCRPFGYYHHLPYVAPYYGRLGVGFYGGHGSIYLGPFHVYW